MPIIHATESTFEDVIQKGVVIVDFWAEWCGPCRMIAPIIEELAHEYEGRIQVVKVDIEQARELVEKLGIISIPTIHVYIEGEKKEENVGLIPKQNLVDLFEKHA